MQQAPEYVCDLGSAASGTEAAVEDVAGGFRSRDLDTSQRSSERRFSRGCCAIVVGRYGGLSALGLPQLLVLRSSVDEATLLLAPGLRTHASGEADVRSRATRSVHNPRSENTRSSPPSSHDVFT